MLKHYKKEVEQLASCKNNCPHSLVQYVAKIRTIQPASQTIPYQPSAWARYIGALASYQAIVHRFPSSISRSGLKLLGQEALSDRAKLSHLFVATMIFGFGTVGYGPYRTSAMISGLEQQPTLLNAAVNRLMAGEVSVAHSGFRLPMCRTPFISKFFYAVGLGADLRPLPLILDSRVASALGVMHERGEIDQMHYYRKSNWTSDGYANYVQDLDVWASNLDCSADQIEMYLFQHSAQIP